MKTPRFDRVQLKLFRDGKKGDFLKAGRIIGFDMVDPLVIAVAEADRLLVLDDLDPIEDAAPDIAGSFEAVRSVAGDQNCAC